MKMNNKGFALIELVFVLFFIFATIGEIRCIYKFIQCDFKPSYKAEVIYGVGIFTGFGCVLGYFNFGE